MPRHATASRSGPLVVVGCASRKVWNNLAIAPDQPAGQAYASPIFKKSRAYAEQLGCAWVILSAKYGFLQPEEMIRDYDETFNRHSPGLVDAPTLKRQVKKKGLDRYSEVLVLAGRSYVVRVRAAFEGTGARIVEPMKGLRLGMRLRWLSEKLERGKRL